MAIDREAAAEFERKHGVVAGNAEALIETNRRRFPQELREASLAAVDVSATQALDLNAIDKQVDGRVVSGSVRGPFIVVAVEGRDGRVEKKVFDRDEFGPSDAEVKKVVSEEAPAPPPKQAKPKKRAPKKTAESE